MAEHETTADIIAEIRALSNPISDGIIAINGRSIADRLEAAIKRERGDCAKLREAAVKCCEIALQWQADEAAGVAGTTDKPHARSAAEAVIDMEFELNAALSVPPRQCDVGTAEKQQARHYAWCRKHGIDGDNKVHCAHPDMSCDLCTLRWAQMPYKANEEGGAK